MLADFARSVRSLFGPVAPPIGVSLDAPLTCDDVRKCLYEVMDPEVGLNIVDLGLVYRIDVDTNGIDVDFTLTSPACPLAEVVRQDAQRAIHALVAGSTPVCVNLVWKPAWTPERMSTTARKRLGW